jgi:hypothetical protein
MALTDNLQAFYKLSDLSDSSGNNRTLTNNGNVSFASGKIGDAAFGDGTNYFTSDLQIGGLQNLTFVFWTNHADKEGDLLDEVFGSWTAGSGPLFSGFGGVGQAQSTGYSTFGVALNTEVGGMQFFWDQTPRTTNDWRFIAVKFIGGQSLSIKINDEAWQTFPVNGTTLVAQNDLVRLLDAGDNYGLQNSKLDAFGIWNRALSDSEFAELYNNGTGLELNPPNYRGEWDNFADYGQDDVVSVNGVYWKLTGLGGWTVGGAPGLGYGWTLLGVTPYTVRISGNAKLQGNVKFA